MIYTSVFDCDNFITDLRPRGSECVISTLDPHRIQASDALNIVEGQPVICASFESGMVEEINLPKFFPGHPYRQYLNSYGFLYYYRPNELPETAGEICIRLTPTPNPSTFGQGQDLKYPGGYLWSIPLFKIVSFTQFDVLCQQLVRDKFITPSLISHCKTLALGAPSLFTGRGPSHIVHWWQPFELDFSKKNHTKYTLLCTTGLSCTSLNITILNGTRVENIFQVYLVLASDLYLPHAHSS